MTQYQIKYLILIEVSLGLSTSNDYCFPSQRSALSQPKESPSLARDGEDEGGSCKKSAKWKVTKSPPNSKVIKCTGKNPACMPTPTKVTLSVSKSLLSLSTTAAVPKLARSRSDYSMGTYSGISSVQFKLVVTSIDSGIICTKDSSINNSGLVVFEFDEFCFNSQH